MTFKLALAGHMMSIDEKGYTFLLSKKFSQYIKIEAISNFGILQERIILRLEDLSKRQGLHNMVKDEGVKNLVANF